MSYVIERSFAALPGFPRSATLDLTYRCNNRCRHCWLMSSPDEIKGDELGFDEVRAIADEAAQYGCREWGISGGEPLLRPDFTEIFEYLTALPGTYCLNTNGTLIDRDIAGLLKRKGHKLISLYGAKAEVHDHITRTPGSFERTVQGMRYLCEAGAGFTVQIMPMKDNQHQLQEMVSIADSMSRPWKLGGEWLYLSACGDPARNREIIEQRLDPRTAVEMSSPWPFNEGAPAHNDAHSDELDDRLFRRCIESCRSLHIDPYGRASFCCYVKDPGLRYDLRSGSLREYCDGFLPSIVDEVRGGQEFRDNCGSCDLRSECNWCATYAYLEHRRYSAKVDYLCSMAKEQMEYKMNWQQEHRRYYEQGGVTIQVESDLPILDETYHPKLRLFEVDKCGEDVIRVRLHHGEPSPLDDPGDLVYDQEPWTIFRKGSSWVGRMSNGTWMACNSDYSSVDVYNANREAFEKGMAQSLTMLPTDGIILSQYLAYRNAFSVHSSGAVVDGKGLLFVGHSGAGKSTIVKLLDGRAEILCDERIVVREWPEGFRIHGSWSHGEVPIVSPNSAPLKAICFLVQSEENSTQLIEEKSEVFERLIPCIVTPLETREWWDMLLNTVERVMDVVPCYILKFDKSGRVFDTLRLLCSHGD